MNTTANTTTREPLSLKYHFFTDWENIWIAELPKRQRKTLLCFIENGLPLNKRMRRIWEDVQRNADSSEMSHWLSENDGWNME